jgi:hypothetical protein
VPQDAINAAHCASVRAVGRIRGCVSHRIWRLETKRRNPPFFAMNRVNPMSNLVYNGHASISMYFLPQPSCKTAGWHRVKSSVSADNLVRYLSARIFLCRATINPPQAGGPIWNALAGIGRPNLTFVQDANYSW